MTEVQELEPIEVSELFAKCAELRHLGYRLVQICCSNIGEGNVEISYSFDREFQFKTLRITGPVSTQIPSIQQVYECAYLYENEISDLFGVQITDMLVDFKGKLYKLSQAAPFADHKKKETEGSV